MQGISIFSVFAWCFFLTSIIGAMILTSLHHPLVRRYRQPLISITLSCLFLGLVSSLSPLIIKRLNPTESRLVPLEELSRTIWSEPVQNPIVEVSESLTNDEIAWTSSWKEKLQEFKISSPALQFRYKLQLPFQLTQFVTAFGQDLVMVDDAGNVRGVNAYTGLKHWSLDLGIHQVQDFVVSSQLKRMWLLDHSSVSQKLQLTCIYLAQPSVLWSRTFPSSEGGRMAFHFDTQTVVATTGSSGVWAVSSKTGDLLWKRPEIYSVLKPIHTSGGSIGKLWVLFEPMIAKRPGSWHWLDDQTGKSVSKVTHQISEMQDLQDWGEAALTQTPSEESGMTEISRLEKPELHSKFSEKISGKVTLLARVGTQQFFVMNDQNQAEMRLRSDGQMVWQRALSGVSSQFISFSPDQKLFVMPLQDQALSFFDVEQGNYLLTVPVSQSVLAATFFGDWFYVLSERALWAYSVKR